MKDTFTWAQSAASHSLSSARRVGPRQDASASQLTVNAGEICHIRSLILAL